MIPSEIESNNASVATLVYTELMDAMVTVSPLGLLDTHSLGLLMTPHRPQVKKPPDSGEVQLNSANSINMKLHIVYKLLYKYNEGIIRDKM